MRFRPTFLALGLASLALSAQAQTPPKYERPANDNSFSVFVYEQLGATPSVRLPPMSRAEPAPERARVKADAPAQGATKAAPAVHAGAPAAPAGTPSTH